MIIDAASLPTSVEKGVKGGPMFSTSVHSTDGGVTSTNQNWTYPLYHGQIGYGIRSKADLNSVIQFFFARRGRARGFLFRDWSDYELVNENIGTGNGVLTNFQITRTYTDTVLPFIRRITRPIEAGLNVYKDAVLVDLSAWSLLSGGIVSFVTPPANGVIVTATGEFDVPVQFSSDQLDIEMDLWNVGSIPSIPIREVRE